MRNRSFHKIPAAGFLFCLLLCSFCFGLEKKESRIPIAPSHKEISRPFDSSDPIHFKKPPKVCYPETWFHYIGGNVSYQGITADLEAIAAAGFSGIQLFHGQFGGPWPGTDRQIPCLSPDWDSAVKHTASECKRLGLRFTMQNCPGWAMSGGPWIDPEHAMRILFCGRTDFPSPTGLRNIKIQKPSFQKDKDSDYHDLFVLAFPTPLDDQKSPLIPISFKSDLPDLPWKDCFAGNAKMRLTLSPTDKDHPHWIEITLPEEASLRTVVLSSINGFLHQYCYEPGVEIKIEGILTDGTRSIMNRSVLPQSSWQDRQPISLACDEVRAKTFRVEIVNQHNMKLNSLQFFSAARINNWEAGAGWTLRSILRSGELPKQASSAFIDGSKILDLTDKINDQGDLIWTAPPGKWTVLRIGHINAGRRNGPAPPEGTGWECDKLSEAGPNAHFAGYIGRLNSGSLSGGLLNGMLMDSWECSTQTWTKDLDKIFQKKRGYVPVACLPALFGYVVDNHENSIRFLLDWRRTVGDLFANAFYGRMAELAHANGLSVQYETAAGDIFPADILEYYKHADVPMCEFWQPYSTDGFVGSINFKPIRPTASAARIYGKTRVSAEAFTSFELTWDEHWEMLKDVFNYNAVQGVTHPVFHTCTHNPQVEGYAPGSSLGSKIGTPFLRKQTWWKHLSSFTDYLARCTFLLERGRPVSDVLWYLGDEIDHKPDQNAPFPKGYRYDYCNPDGLLHCLSVQDHKITTREVISYRLLWIPDSTRMLPETLEKIEQLVRNGANLLCDPPRGLATLSDSENAQKRFDRVCINLWGARPEPGMRALGKGTVLSGISLEKALQMLKIEPDLVVLKEGGKPNSIEWLHRQTEGADWYFIASSPGSAFRGMIGVKAVENQVEIWDPVFGTITPANAKKEGDRFLLDLDLPIAGSCFIVQRKSDSSAEGKSRSPGKITELPISNPWTLTFPAGWGISKPITIDRLLAWKDLDLSPEGKAFSGSVQYKSRMDIKDFDKTARYYLDLGEVEMIADVRVNGQAAGTVWAHPYRVEITDVIRAGENRLEIEITGTWFNRLVYDAGLPEPDRKTWTIGGPGKESPLRKSGLLGPVRLLGISEY
ncbi:MAG: glycosyl hydrolase [Planctomycetia bacterium]|nr:glycosyl hydrolase [Planctomycetia bacterium]